MNENSTNSTTSPKSSLSRFFRFSITSILVLFLLVSIYFARNAEDIRQAISDQSYIVPTDFDLKTGKNILWTVPIGHISYGGPVVSQGKVLIGTNNTAEYLTHFPAEKDYGVLLCFDAADGKFLWQHTNEKLKSGRMYDWLYQGVTSRPTVEADRVFYVSNRCEVVCLDLNGFFDNEDDGQLDHSKTVLDQTKEADVVWKFDMIKQLGVVPSFASCSGVAISEDAVFVVTGNGLDSARSKVANPDAPSFLALDKKTGTVLWSDNSPGKNILDGQWGTPVYAKNLAGKPQVIFPGGDGWLYSFDPAGNPIWHKQASLEI